MDFKSVAFHHFGCKVNFSEASSLSRQCKELGLDVLDFHSRADIYVISTCVVTSIAEKKCRAAIRQAHKLNPDALIAVIGCFAELKPDLVAGLDGVGIVLGHTGKFNLVEEIEKFSRQHGEKAQPDVAEEPGPFNCESAHPLITTEQRVTEPTEVKRTFSTGDFIPSWSSGDRTRSFLKIQDGCDYFCTYCTIPLARGRSRSDTIEGILRQTQEIIASGAREIVLTGVNIGDFGRHNGEDFLTLIRTLDLTEGLQRVRISSIEPDLLSDEIIEFVAGSKHFLPHFHIPLQSGCDRILQLMRRKYDTRLYRSRVERIRKLMPGACIAADVIVGFPGETEEDFEETRRFLQETDISYLHVFTYSQRDHTVAAKIPDRVDEKTRKARSHMLHELSDHKKKDFYERHNGLHANVLFESDDTNGWMHGFTANYIKVKHPYDAGLVNQVREVLLTGTDSDGVYLVKIMG